VLSVKGSVLFGAGGCEHACARQLPGTGLYAAAELLLRLAYKDPPSFSDSAYFVDFANVPACSMHIARVWITHSTLFAFQQEEMTFSNHHERLPVLDGKSGSAGDLQLLSNHTQLHTRSAFLDPEVHPPSGLLRDR